MPATKERYFNTLCWGNRDCTCKTEIHKHPELKAFLKVKLKAVLKRPSSNLCPSLGSPPQAKISPGLLHSSALTTSYLPCEETLAFTWHDGSPGTPRGRGRPALAVGVPRPPRRTQHPMFNAAPQRSQILLTVQFLTISHRFCFFFNTKSIWSKTKLLISLAIACSLADREFSRRFTYSTAGRDSLRRRDGRVTRGWGWPLPTGPGLGQQQQHHPTRLRRLFSPQSAKRKGKNPILR